MSRALGTLLAGIVAAVLLAVVISGGRNLSAVLGPVLVTTGLGVAVLAVVAHRARLRERAEQLEAEQAQTNEPARTPDQEEADRG